MPWLYNTVTGDVEHQNEAEYLTDASLNIAGWDHLTKLPIPDSDTTAQAVAYVVAQQKAGKLKGPAPTTSNAQANANASQYVAKQIPGGAAVVSVSDFLGRLTQASTWLRIGEGILGIVLIAVGVARMTNAVSVATKIAGAVK
jgi:hypothetical protein